MKSAWTAAPSALSERRARSNSFSRTETTSSGSGRATTQATTSRPRSRSASIRTCSASRDRMAARRPSRSSSSGDGVGSAAAVPPSQVLNGLEPIVARFIWTCRPSSPIRGTHRHDKTAAMRWRNLKCIAPLIPEVMGTESDRPTALITGANRGLGLETSAQLRARGFRVVLTSRDEKKGTAAVRGLDPDGGDVLYHQLDITDRASISGVAKDLPALVPRLDLLVNNA